MKNPHVPGLKSGRTSAGFTFTELLVVMATMAILAALTLPSFVGTSTSQQLVASGNKTVDIINAARQNAVSSDAMTALILPTNTGNPSLDYHSFVIMQLASGTTAWTQVSKWESLAPGVTVDCNNSTFLNEKPTLNVAPASVNYLGQSIDLTKATYMVFLPDGNLVGPPANPPTLQLVSGTSAGGATTYRGTTGSTPKNYYLITVNLYTGLPKVDRP